MTVLFAQPYDVSAIGFYFKSVEEYRAKAAENKNEEGYIIEEYELQFIDGETINAELFKALDINQVNFEFFLEACDTWDDNWKTRVIIAVGEAGYEFDLEKDSPDQFDVDIYEMDKEKEGDDEDEDGELDTTVFTRGLTRSAVEPSSWGQVKAAP